MPVPLIITLDRAAGTAELRKGDWWQVVPITDLPKQMRFYRGLWARKPNGKAQTNDKTPGPWARFYEVDLRAIEAAIREAGQ